MSMAIFCTLQHAKPREKKFLVYRDRELLVTGRETPTARRPVAVGSPATTSRRRSPERHGALPDSCPRLPLYGRPVAAADTRATEPWPLRDRRAVECLNP
jgi:hypothetical protein